MLGQWGKTLSMGELAPDGGSVVEFFRFFRNYKADAHPSGRGYLLVELRLRMPLIEASTDGQAFLPRFCRRVEKEVIRIYV